jgi:methylmalonyl-CoA/ethylmalonyl-CoA epimerase
MITKIDHVGIAVKGLEQRLPFWAEALGLEVAGMETVDAENVRVAFLPAGPSRIELLEPIDEDSTVARFLARRGEGIHHLTLEVTDLRGALEQLEQRGVRTIGEAPRRGAGDRAVAFLHPKTTGGVLIELVEQEPAVSQAVEPMIRPGSTVLLYLREPKEKLWGLLRRIDSAGVVLEGIDLSSFDDWIVQIDREEESVVGPSVLFVPMGRVEKILLDRSSGQLPSLAERFQRRTGRTVEQVLSEGRD